MQDRGGYLKPNILFVLTLNVDFEDLNQRYYHVLIMSLVFRIIHYLAMHPSPIALQCFAVNTTGALSLQIIKSHRSAYKNTLL